ncbi:MAG: MBL fold metallo-hydrolase [Pseudomonadales bacterium]|nr:MBL fold metallo-hydrolase [Pseudomonadales bacterium]
MSFMSIPTKAFILCLAVLGTLPAQAADAALTLKVITANESSLHAAFTLVMGKQDMVLIDAPFTRADAHRLVADMLETGKRLTALYVTHDHPDHFWSMQVIMDAYPEAQVLSHPEVVADIWRSIPFKIARWSPMLGSNGPAHPTAPTPLAQDWFELEGHRLEVLGPMQGDHHHATAIWIPELQALVAGDLVFHGIHVWLGEVQEAQRLEWLANLDALMAMEPAIVVAGHKRPGLDDTAASLRFTRDYIADFNREAKTAINSDALIARMRQLYPNVIDVLDNFILSNSAQVGVGEVPPWEE